MPEMMFYFLFVFSLMPIDSFFLRRRIDRLEKRLEELEYPKRLKPPTKIRKSRSLLDLLRLGSVPVKHED